MAAVHTQCLDQDNSKPLKYKTWVLRVSIHCEGCKRKVKRILHSVEGVYTIDVDTRQHKVVVTGNVDSNTLLKKLEKSGKHAELWPDFHHKIQQQFHDEQQQGNQNQNPNQIPNQNPNVVDEQQENNSEPQKGAENNLPQPQQQVKEVRFEANIPATGEPQKPPGNNAVNGGGGSGGSGGAKKKKKKKKGQNGNNTPNNTAAPNNNASSGNGGAGVVVEQVVNGGPPSSESQPPPQQNPNPNPSPESMSPPRQHPPNARVYEYPPTYYAPPPVYAVSYNTAYPSYNYSASYYSALPPCSNAYVHQGGDVEPPAPLDWNPHAVPPSDSFEMFSDENPNACSVM